MHSLHTMTQNEHLHSERKEQWRHKEGTDQSTSETQQRKDQTLQLQVQHLGLMMESYGL